MKKYLIRAVLDGGKVPFSEKMYFSDEIPYDLTYGERDAIITKLFDMEFDAFRVDFYMYPVTDIPIFHGVENVE